MLLTNLSVFGGVGIILGLWTYAYNIMANLGNRLTLQTPVRAVAVQLGSAITIIIATLLRTCSLAIASRVGAQV